MPIYEFYCETCNTVFNFFSRGVDTTKIPDCPKCRRALRRQMSLFAKVTRGKEEPAEDGMPPLDEAKMEGIEHDKARELISRLEKSGELYMPRHGFLKPTQKL